MQKLHSAKTAKILNDKLPNENSWIVQKETKI